MRFEDVVRRLETLPAGLPAGPPGLLPELAEGRSGRPRPTWTPGAGRPAAVLVLLFPGANGEARLVLTERVDRGGHHSGEVSFPGGRAEPEDADLVATALREAAEEVALDAPAAGVRVLGTVPPLWIPVSDYSVTPVVAIAERRPILAPQPTEVASILEPPIQAFLPGAPLVRVEREVRGWALRFSAYEVDGLVVWGMTARVLGGLGAYLVDA